jgi:hypothetical protein
MTSHLLPCTCSATIEVGTGQAGGHVVCPACGASVAVPKLREFRRLQPVVRERASPGGAWTWRHASVLAGIAVAVAAGVAAALVGAGPRPRFEAEAIRTAVANADDRSIIEAWKALASSGVERPPSPVEQALVRIARFRRGAAAGLAALGAAGAVCALGGGIALAMKRKVHG